MVWFYAIDVITDPVISTFPTALRFTDIMDALKVNRLYHVDYKICFILRKNSHEFNLSFLFFLYRDDGITGIREN